MPTPTRASTRYRRTPSPLVVLAAALIAGLSIAPDAGAADSRPNIVLVLVDDLRWDALGHTGHPFVTTPHIDRLAAEGVRFRSAFVTTSLCSPSRASILTGLYAHRHDVRDNSMGDPRPGDVTFPTLLQDAGYETAFIGKWHMEKSAEPRPGFDHWLSFEGQGVYRDPGFNENGRDYQAEGYVTDLLNDAALDWLERPREKPFFLFLSHKAVHAPFTPAARHRDRFSDESIAEPESWGDGFEDKPLWQRKLARERWRRQTKSGRTGGGIAEGKGGASLPKLAWNPRVGRIDYFRSLLAVDEGLGRILALLEEKGELDSTVVVFTSDNGYSLGEHRRHDKRTIYEESIRIPLLLRHPPLARPGTQRDELVLNLDLAPTFLELAGEAVPDSIQGRSLVPLLRGQAEDWRESFLYEYFFEQSFAIPTILGVRTRDWTYASYPELDDLEELYDLRKDPQQLRNLATLPEYEPQLSELRRELEGLKQETGYRAEARPRPKRVTALRNVLHHDFADVRAGVVPDLTGKGNLGHLKGLRVTDLEEDQKRAALECGGEGRMEVARSSSLNHAHIPFAVEVRVRADSSEGVLVSRGGGVQGYALHLRDGRPHFVVNPLASPVEISSPEPLADGWNHLIGALHEGGGASLYLNGELVAEGEAGRLIPGSPTATLDVCAPARKGLIPGGPLPRFRGRIAELRFWRGEVSASMARERARAIEVSADGADVSGSERSRSAPAGQSVGSDGPG